MIEALRHTSLLFVKDEQATKGELVVLVSSNLFLFTLAVSLHTPADNASGMFSILLTGVACTFLPLLVIPFIMLFGYEKAVSDVPLRFSRTIMVCFFISLAFFAFNMFDSISLVKGKNYLYVNRVSGLDRSTYYIFVALIYGLLGPTLMIFWTHSKWAYLKQAYSNYDRIILWITYGVAVLINSFLIYTLVLMPDLRNQFIEIFVKSQ